MLIPHEPVIREEAASTKVSVMYDQMPRLRPIGMLYN